MNAGGAATPRQAFPYDGPETLRHAVVAALTKVVDPELALSIVDVGLVYGVSIAAERAEVLLTMTSAACPVAGLIVEEVESELERVLPQGTEIDVELVWEPPWTPECMSPLAKSFMAW